MALVQSPHRRDEADGLPGRARLADEPSRSGDGRVAGRVASVQQSPPDGAQCTRRSAGLPPENDSSLRREAAALDVPRERARGLLDDRRRGPRSGARSAGAGPRVRPITSWKTRTWPSQAAPAPMPIVGTGICPRDLRRRAPPERTRERSRSSRRRRAPARPRRISRAAAASRPWTLKPPNFRYDCGVRPTCPMTGMSAARIASTAGEDRAGPPRP